MKIFKYFLIGLGACALLGIFMLLVVKRGARDGENANAALHVFLTHAKNRDHQSAHRMFTEELQGDMPLRDLEKQWEDYERVHGAPQEWKPSPGFLVSGGQISTVPRFVQLRYLVRGARDGNTAGVIFVRLIPHSGDEWRISKIELRP